jgi:cytoskeleton protein RodZ
MPSFGETLKTQRELRGVSLREMADSTKISVRFLRALEEDRPDVLPGGIYPRAFVKQYALFIGLDPERTVADFLLRQGRPEPERRPATAAKWPRLTPGAVFFAVVVVVAAFLTLRRPHAEDKGQPVTGARTSAATTVPAVLPTDRLYPAPAPKSGPEPGRDSLLLTMTAQQDCWVEARADGETIINRVLAEGESETLEARGEIVLSVGNAGGLSIRVNDRPGLPLGRNGEVRKNIVITRKSLPALVKGDETTSTDGQSG